MNNSYKVSIKQNGIQSASFCVIGGDLRYVKLCEVIASEGCKITAIGFDNEVTVNGNVEIVDSIEQGIKSSEYIILPMPALQNGSGCVNAPFSQKCLPIDEVITLLDESKTVFGGKIPTDIQIAMRDRGAQVVDYLECEQLAVANAVPTAEGAIQIAMEETPITIDKSRCLTIGYGRVAKALVKRLALLGAYNTVAVRREEAAKEVRQDGYEAISTETLSEHIGSFDMIFNTVPSLIIDKKVLQCVDPGAMIMDLASKPGGVDMECSKQLGIKTIWALSLPGRVAPFTAGKIIKDTVFSEIERLNQERKQL